MICQFILVCYHSVSLSFLHLQFKLFGRVTDIFQKVLNKITNTKNPCVFNEHR